MVDLYIVPTYAYVLVELYIALKSVEFIISAALHKSNEMGSESKT